jgi:putative colanic acid biosynthesis UDP-glucose lipid carrier transferase
MDDITARQDNRGSVRNDSALSAVSAVVIRLDARATSAANARPDLAGDVEAMPSPVLVAGAARISGSRLKRGVDLGFAAVGLLFMTPFLLALALLIRFESTGPALFKQRRTGRNGATFTIYKFRTMRVVEDGVEIVQASENDHRTTRLGRFLRRSSIDELPQLLNVLRGEMSLIGPRPHALAHDVHYGACVPSYEARFLVRPGLSGLAQVRGCRGATPETEMMAARVRWDLTYIETWSLALEARIFLDTIRVFFFHPAPF